MTISSFIETYSKKLSQQGISTARLDSFILLKDATGKDRAWLLAHPDTKLEPLLQAMTLQTLHEQIARRARHEPLADIRGKVEFYGREFLVDEHVLVPRPETETMITLLKKIARGYDQPLTIVDVGTGSGALAITAELEVPGSRIWAIDIDERCLSVGRRNARVHRMDIKWTLGNLLAVISTDSEVDLASSILLCNLPYVPAGYQVNQAAQHEPKVALYGGQDGLDLYRELFKQIDTTDHKPGYILTESLDFQHHPLQEIAAKSGYQIVEQVDLIQAFKRV